jgi:hypothetical protein
MNEYCNASMRSFLPQFIEESDLHRISQHSEQMKSCALGKSIFQVKQRGKLQVANAAATIRLTESAALK